jgi:hypothetical protein
LSFEGNPQLAAVDDEHLRLLSIFHYVVAGVTALIGCCPSIHLAVGIALLAGAFPPDTHGEAPPRFIGAFFVVFSAAMILSLWTLAVFLLLAGRNLARRRGHTFCFVVACIACLFMPFGTVLGAFTIIVLSRPSVKARFGLPVPGVAPTA